MRQLAPIVYFAYNRPEHTLHTLQALSNCRLAMDSDLYIYIDGPKATASEQDRQNIEAVKSIAQQKQWCKNVSITIAKKNKGLFQSITEGITAIVNQFGKVIIVEDDVLVSPGFLEYVNDALDVYKDTPEVMHISAYSLPDFSSVAINGETYFYNHTTCWGWGTWKRAWDKFDADASNLMKRAKKEKSIYHLNLEGTFEFYWGLRSIAQGKFQDWNYNWHTSVYLNDGMCLHPTHSLVSNIGHDGSGTNCTDSAQFKNHKYLADKVVVTPIPIIENKAIRKFHKKLMPLKDSIIFSIKHYIRYLVK